MTQTDIQEPLADRFKEIELDELEQARRKREKLAEIAAVTWKLASRGIHRLKNNKPLDFVKYPFLKEIYQNQSPKLVLSTGTQLGKSEYLVVRAAAMAALGMNVFYVISKYEKRNKFVADRIDPAFSMVAFYKKCIEVAVEAGRRADSVQHKHFGEGSINFVSSESEKDFSTFSADASIADEYQECKLDNMAMIDDRMDGSDWQFKVIAGNPRGFGSETNPNLDYQFKLSDQRYWNIPCGNCKLPQILGWLTHVVDQEVNKAGGIISVTPRDKDWDPTKDLDMRPICIECKRPMNRLSQDGFWKPVAPEKNSAGFSLSNLYNPKRSLKDNFARYLAAKNSPSALQTFINNQLGLPFSGEGDCITAEMLEAASAGSFTCLPPYRFVPSNMLVFKKAV